MKWAKYKSGFTIVELLIVVVVIAILAAITIVAYNGIQNRAKASVAQSTAAQATKKIATYSIQSGDLYPNQATFLADTGLQTTASTSYQYRVATDLKSFCLTTTTNGLSFFTTNQNMTPAAGACAGHGANGVVAITNLIANPSFETGTSGWTASGNITLSPQATGGLYGSGFHRGTRTSTAAIGLYSPNFNVEPNETYTGRMSVRYPTGKYSSLRFQWYDSGGALLTPTTATSVLGLDVNTWQTLTFTATAPANAVTSRFDIVLNSNSAVAGDSYDIDGVMVTKSSTQYAYADGNSAGWIWNGTDNASSSSGPPQ